MGIINGTNNGGGAATSKVLKDKAGNPIKYINYSTKTDKDGAVRSDYKLTLTGVVVDLADVPATVYGKPEQIDRWPDGNMKINCEIAILQDNGETLCLNFRPGGKSYEKASALRKGLIDIARKITGKNDTTDLTALLGHNISIATKECLLADGSEGKWGAGNPRPWNVNYNSVGTMDNVTFVKDRVCADPDKTTNIEATMATEDMPF